MALPYGDPIISQMRSGKNGDSYIPITETQQIVNSKVVLKELPDKLNRVQVSGNNVTWVEIQSGIPTDTQFLVDYVNGTVLFSSNNNNFNLQFSYFGRGLQYIPASRVYLQDTNGDVTQTLDNLASDTNVAIQNANTSATNAQNAASSATQAASSANVASSNATNAANTTQLIWQPYVSTFSAIAITYPNPQVGWTTQCQDTLIRYRYNGTQWVQYEVGSQGYDVYVGSVPPSNTNSLWLDDNVVSTIIKINVSNTQPTNTNCLWVLPSN